ncbi:hypothetical protein [Caballeronia sp. LZ035]|uniref:hypothetical protein n=1 Tax=Caballeronia sp. LZ035 TaxID=3038568 RepID=UPI00285D41A0|nr:hypothetical protein [Caballeronia sp. LZ035]MDR5757926.1 hypothetical protein [Caballeronia sp. LZ035]
MKHEPRTALRPLVMTAFAAAAFSVVPIAHAGNFSDAAISKGEAGGAAPAEMDLLGSPGAYSDPYGAPTNGRGGQRGPITNGQTAQGVSPTDKLLAQQNGYAGNAGAGARMRATGRKPDTKATMMPQGAAAALYPTPNGLKPPAANAARARDIYKSPY